MRTERLINIRPSPNPKKKYRALVLNPRTQRTRAIDFGATGYQQYKDSTGLRKYTKDDHTDPQRRKRYFTRHSGVPTKTQALNKEWKKSKGTYNAKILSHQYLW